MQNWWSLNLSHFDKLGLKKAVRCASRNGKIAKTNLNLGLIASFNDCSSVIGARCLLSWLRFFDFLIWFIGFVLFGWLVFIVQDSRGGCLLQNTQIELLDFLVNILPFWLTLFALLLRLSSITFASFFVTKWLPYVNVITFPLTWSFPVGLFDFTFLAWHFLHYLFFFLFLK